MLPLMFAQTEFVVLYQGLGVVITCVFGVLNGLLFLPAILALMSPRDVSKKAVHGAEEHAAPAPLAACEFAAVAVEDATTPSQTPVHLVTIVLDVDQNAPPLSSSSQSI